MKVASLFWPFMFQRLKQLLFTFKLVLAGIYGRSENLQSRSQKADVSGLIFDQSEILSKTSAMNEAVLFCQVLPRGTPPQPHQPRCCRTLL
jgi:hypothetical protein